jgi:hypothetical protein
MFPVKPSHTTTSAEPARGEESVRLARELVAFLGLFANRQQPHLRPGDLQYLLGEDHAHFRELGKMLRARVRVRPTVDQHRRTALRGNRDCNRRAKHARDAADLEQRRGEHGARVPRRDHRVCAARADRAAGGDERAVGLRADDLCRLLVHRDSLRRRDEL